MQDEPTPAEILAAVAKFLRETVAGATTGHVSFNVRVAANALEMSRRQILDNAGPAERACLAALLGRDGDLAELNAELCRRIAAGDLTLKTPGLADHLWAATLAKLAVDQPTYWGYRAALAEREREFPPSPHGEGGPRSGTGGGRRPTPSGPSGHLPHQGEGGKSS